jgi:hypothetical protein
MLFLIWLQLFQIQQLETTPADVWSVKSEFGKESLFELGYISTKGYDWGNVVWGGRMESNLRSINGTSRRRSFNLKGTGLINGWGFNLLQLKLLMPFRQQVM